MHADAEKGARSPRTGSPLVSHLTSHLPMRSMRHANGPATCERSMATLETASSRRVGSDGMRLGSGVDTVRRWRGGKFLSASWKYLRDAEGAANV